MTKCELIPMCCEVRCRMKRAGRLSKQLTPLRRFRYRSFHYVNYEPDTTVCQTKEVKQS